MAVPTLLQVGNTPILESLHVPFSTQPLSALGVTIILTYGNHCLTFLHSFIMQMHPKHYNLVVLFLFFWQGGERTWICIIPKKILQWVVILELE